MDSHRKTICLLTAIPEYPHPQRILDGIFTQCRKYGYNLAVFGSIANLNLNDRQYVDGEINIYNLVNFDRFDGIIVDTVTIPYDNSLGLRNLIVNRLRKECHVPVVSLELPLLDYPYVENDNEDILREIVRHVVLTHGRKRVCVLTGPIHTPVAEQRLAVYLDELHALGVDVPEEHIRYGDFWYTSGEQLAEDIAAHSISMPDAVICASDHMALGLMERLKKHGIRIPEDIVIVGYEATEAASLNPTTLTSFYPNDTRCAADAVDILRRVMEPGEPVESYTGAAATSICPGMSCGCEPNYLLTAQRFSSALYQISPNYNVDVVTNGVDIGILMENYVSEMLTSSDTVEECIRNIYSSVYFVNPMVNYYLCLREDWLVEFDGEPREYPDRMKIVCSRSNIGEGDISAEEYSIVFKTAEMLPRLWKQTEEPCVFYFSPVHFSNRTLGYSVLQRKMSDPHKLNIVYRNWLRFVNNSLEMMRAKNRYILLSVRDQMTGLLNRRGMYTRLDKMLGNAAPEDSALVCVIDMDGLKYINDTFGHKEGDYGIRVVSASVTAAAEKNEICVRAGGDEFYLIGIGSYAPDAGQQKIARFNSIIAEKAAKSEKPFTVSASIGCALCRIGSLTNIDDILLEADEEMYKYIILRKKHRQ